MRTKNSKRLVLGSETLWRLDSGQLSDVVGGGPTGIRSICFSFCPTCPVVCLPPTQYTCPQKAEI
jgi:hypothetical protein